MRAARIPKNGLWRVQHSSGVPPAPEPLETTSVQRAGNRFDAPAGEFEVRYYGSTRTGCFAETLARFRPAPGLADLDRYYCGDLDLSVLKSADRRSPSAP